MKQGVEKTARKIAVLCNFWGVRVVTSIAKSIGLSGNLAVSLKARMTPANAHEREVYTRAWSMQETFNRAGFITPRLAKLFFLCFCIANFLCFPLSIFCQLFILRVAFKGRIEWVIWENYHTHGFLLRTLTIWIEYVLIICRYSGANFRLVRFPPLSRMQTEHPKVLVSTVDSCISKVDNINPFVKGLSIFLDARCL